MKLSAPLFRLKHRAKTLARAEGIPRHAALDRIAREEGFQSWSLLAAHVNAGDASQRLFARLQPGDLTLIGARPRNGKTQLCLRLLIEAMKAGHDAVLFSLDLTEADLQNLFRNIGEEADRYSDRFLFDGSDDISADYMIERLEGARPGAFVGIDYLQLLDQKRVHPELSEQMSCLRSFAKTQGLTMIFISQVNRAFDPVASQVPGLDDIRLPNPVDLDLFDTSCFLNDGEAHIASVRG